ncbi:hypothetical protein GCM10023350_11460 [Nocardioides endophyticus]|uniref:Uncharacterized protein n=1 Tax=Nocardioides endophyticus TaxID=1353775 RepID=A0ABP8YJZ0_9ACTN
MSAEGGAVATSDDHDGDANDLAAKDGSYKIVEECSMPYTGRGVVQRTITDLRPGRHPRGLRLVEFAPGVSQDEVRSKTQSPIT